MPTLDRTMGSVFQDRCLKPLGHPSALTTSNTYALPPPAPDPARSDARYWGRRSPLSETGPLKDLGAEKENPAKARGKSQVRRMSGQLGDWGNRKAVQPAFHR